MSERTMTDASYRYAFNGKEKDTQGLGDQTHYDYGFRIYNPEIARFLSVDPLTGSYPMLTPYQFASNTPIWAIDIDGLEAHRLTQIFDAQGEYQGFSFEYDENAAPVNNNQIHYVQQVVNFEGDIVSHSSKVVDANDVNFQGTDLSPTKAPASVVGSLNYYKFRDNDFNVRQTLMDDFWSWQPSSPDYYLNYGDKYINRFTSELFPKLSERGQEWLEATLVNLQVAIEEQLGINPNLETQNSKFQDFAFDSHVGVYIDAGLFDLPVSDLIQIGLTPDVKDLIGEDGRRQALGVGQEYLEFAKENPDNFIIKLIEVANILKNLTSEKD